MEFEKKKIEWIEYDLLSPFSSIFQGTFLRHGGVSVGSYISLNIGNAVGDHPDSVKVNREMIKKNMKISHLVFANQEHGKKVIEITKENFDKVVTVDALVTKEKDIAIAISHADCQAAIFYDPKQEIIGIAHAGWKGLMKNIYQETVDFFVDRFNSNVEDLIVSISPSLCSKHAEFKDYKKEFPKEYWSYQVEPFHFDLKKIGLDQLLNAKLLAENIEVSDICTYCNEEEYFSHRRDHVTGRHATAVALID